MVVLTVPDDALAKSLNLEDHDIDCTWAELAFRQHRGDFGELNHESLVWGGVYDCLAMLDRNSLEAEFKQKQRGRDS